MKTILKIVNSVNKHIVSMILDMLSTNAICCRMNVYVIYVLYLSNMNLIQEELKHG